MSALVVYTALIGKNGDRLRQPKWPARDNGVKFICFTDRDIEQTGRWELRRVSGSDIPNHGATTDPRRVARYYKLMPHEVLPEAKVWLWQDACLVLKVDPLTIFRQAHGLPVATFKHPNRDCIYDEHLACLKYRKGEPELMQLQVDHLQVLGYPPGNGLAETSCIVRRNTNEIRRFNERWWEILKNYSVRDQLSFDFVCWEMGMQYAILTGAKLRNPYFITYQH